MRKNIFIAILAIVGILIGRLAHFFVSKIIIHLNKGNYYGCKYG